MAWQEELREEMRQSRVEVERAARVAMAEWIQELGPWELFGGLTFDPRRCAHGLRSDGPCSMEQLGPSTWLPRRVPLNKAAVRFQSYIRAAERMLGRSIEYVAGVEAQRSGAGHIHPLLRLQDGLQMGDIKALGGLWYERNGYAVLEVPRSQEDVTGYCAKYLTGKVGLSDLLMSPRLRRVLQGVGRQGGGEG